MITTLSVSANDDNYFVVTAYYSPLPGQDYYITGNYEDELILNWRWIAWASGKSVFSGMLAAPRKYSFGTKIYLDGLGIWAVEDRGWAIVPAGQRGYSYDRIDVWMGYWDEGLLRANFWGKRKVYGYVVDSGNNTSLDYQDVPAPTWATTGLQKMSGAKSKLLITPEVYKESIFDVSLWKWSDAKLISEMQDIFVELWYIVNNTWEYDSETISWVYDFQIEHSIVSKESDIWAWSYGPKTRKKLQEKYQEYKLEEEKKKQLIKDVKEIQEAAQAKAEQTVDELWMPKYWDISYEVRKLQKILTDFWYFDHKDTAIFWDITRTAILHYQISKHLIESEEEYWAWLVGPKTRKQLESDLYEKYLNEYLEENELLTQYEVYLKENNSINQ